jgi:hypothetical protein
MFTFGGGGVATFFGLGTFVPRALGFGSLAGGFVPLRADRDIKAI